MSISLVSNTYTYTMTIFFQQYAGIVGEMKIYDNANKDF